MKLLPWQSQIWQQLLAVPGNLPHAMLLAGPAGLGKLAFAHAMAARLLCEQAATGMSSEGGSMACGHCSSCTWLASGNHPDFRLVQPEDLEETPERDEVSDSAPSPAAKGKGKAETGKGKAGGTVASGTIRVDQIRALADFVFVGSHRHGNRVVIVNPAEAMNPAAANSLLKILEEPPASVYFILVSDAWRKLLPTVRSRCRMVVFGRPDQQLAEQWLKAEGVKSPKALLDLTGGTPLLARDWAAQGKLEQYQKAIEVLADKPVDPVAMAAKWSALLKGDEAFDLPLLVETVQKWVFDLVQLKISGHLRYHEAWRDKLDPLGVRASRAGLLACYNDLLRIRAVARHPLNTQLFLEDMAARYLRAIASTKN